MSKHAYVTLIANNEYIWGGICLGLSLKAVNSKYKLIYLVSEDVNAPELNYINTEGLGEIIRIKSTVFNEGQHIPYKYTRGKFEVFNLVDYDSVGFVDADAFFVKNFDHLLEKNENRFFDSSQAVINDGRDPLPYIHFMGGIFIVKPDKNIYKLLNHNVEIYTYFSEEAPLTDVFTDKANNLQFTLDYNLFDYINHIGKYPKYWMIPGMNIDLAKKIVQDPNLYSSYCFAYQQDYAVLFGE